MNIIYKFHIKHRPSQHMYELLISVYHHDYTHAHAHTRSSHDLRIVPMQVEKKLAYNLAC